MSLTKIVNRVFAEIALGSGSALRPVDNPELPADPIPITFDNREYINEILGEITAPARVSHKDFIYTRAEGTEIDWSKREFKVSDGFDPVHGEVWVRPDGSRASIMSIGGHYFADGMNVDGGVPRDWRMSHEETATAAQTLSHRACPVCGTVRMLGSRRPDGTPVCCKRCAKDVGAAAAIKAAAQ